VVFSKTGGPCQVNFRQSGHLYDGRTGEYLGFGRETARGLKGSQGRWICRLPYVVKKVETGGTPSIKGGRTWTGYAEIKVKDGRPGRHVVCVKVIGPDGKEYRHYRQKLETKNGRAEIGIPFCWNDPAGRWTMVVTDVATGIRTSRTITLL